MDKIEEDIKQIEEDIKQIEEDAKKIDCHPIIKFVLSCLKCIKDTMRCCF